MKYVITITIVLSYFLISCETSVSYKDIDEITVEGRSSISWKDASRVKIAPAPGDSGTVFSYPRLEELKNGTLLAIYENCSGGTVLLKRSSDGGTTWSDPLTVFSRRNNTNPSVPEIILLKDGTLLAAANYRPAKPYSSDRPFGISVKRSLDGGLTWSGEMVLYQGGWDFENGCWEPAFLQLPSGEVQLYFANETPYTGSDEQNISLLRSFDSGASWTTTPQVVSFRGGSRDGMPVPLYLEERQELLLGIEDKYVGAFKPSVLRESLEGGWSPHVDSSDSRREYHPLVTPLPKNSYAGAPYMQRLPSDEVLLSFQTNYERGGEWNNAHQMVLVGSSKGDEFAHPSYPFPVAIGKHALWNSLEVLSDGSLLAVTSTNGYTDNGAQEIWMVRGTVHSGR